MSRPLFGSVRVLEIAEPARNAIPGRLYHVPLPLLRGYVTQYLVQQCEQKICTLDNLDELSG